MLLVLYLHRVMIRSTARTHVLGIICVLTLYVGYIQVNTLRSLI